MTRRRCGTPCRIVRPPTASPLITLCARELTSDWWLSRPFPTKDDFTAFNRVNSQLLNAPTTLKRVPLRVYVPSSPPDASSSAAGSFKVVQPLVAPRTPNSECGSQGNPPW